MISWDTCCSDRRVSPSDSKSTNEIREGRLSSADREKRSLHAAMQTETRCAAITIVKRNYSELTELTGKANEKERGSRPTSAKSLLVDQQLILATSRGNKKRTLRVDGAARRMREAGRRAILIVIVRTSRSLPGKLLTESHRRPRRHLYHAG